MTNDHSADQRPAPVKRRKIAVPTRSIRCSTGQTPNSSIPSGPAITSTSAPARACQPEAIEIAAQCGFDAINLDGEHGLFSPESIDLMCRVANGYGMSVTARVPNIHPNSPNANRFVNAIGASSAGPFSARFSVMCGSASRSHSDSHSAWNEPGW
jgi:hypothetical protein